MRFFNAVVLWLVCIAGLQAQISVVPTVVHLTSPSVPNVGSISLNVTGGVSPYNYSWNSGAFTTQNLASKPYGTYALKVKDSNADSVLCTYSIGYKAKWDQMSKCILRNDTLFGTNFNVDSWETAITKNTLTGGADGWFEYVLRNMGEYKVIGFTDSLSPLVSIIQDIDHGFYYEQGTLYRIAGGHFAPLLYNVQEGTLLRMERRGDTVEYKVNGNVLISGVYPNVGLKDWKVKGALYAGMSSSMFNVGCSFYQQGNTDFPNYNRLVPTIVHNTGTGASDGSVRVEPLQPGTCTYTWQPGSVVSSSLSSVSAGMYSVTVSDAQQHRNRLVYSVGYKVKWDQLYDAAESGDTIKATGPTVYGQAVSKNTLAAHTDGWVEYTLKDLNQNKFFGFADSLSPMMGNYKDIDYGFYYEGSGTTSLLYGIAGGSFFFISTHAHYPEGTIFRVERVGNVISLKINGVLSNSWIDSSYAKKPLKIKGVLHNYLNGSLINLGCSFYQQGNTDFPNYNRLVPTIVHNTGTGTSDGSVRVEPLQPGTCTYTWQPGSVVSSSVSSVSAGMYSVTVKDAQQHRNTLVYSVGYKVKWDQFYNAAESGDTIKATGPTVYGQAVSKNTLAAHTDGWVEYTLKDLNQNKFFGFADSLSPMMGNYKDIDYGFYYEGSGTTSLLYGIAGGSFFFISTNAAMPEGTIFRVERVGNAINLKINGVLSNSWIDSSYAKKPLKIKAVLHNYLNGSLINLGCSFSQQGNTVFPNYTRLDPSVVHASAVGANDGSITVHTGITNPLSCFWQPGNLTTNPLENITAGNYLLTVEDSLHHINSKYYHVGYKTHWDSLYGATVHGDTLKTTQAYLWGRALTRNTLAAGTDGWFEYVLEDLDKIKYIGFLDSMSADPQNVNDIDYGFYYDAVSKFLYTFYKGSYGYAGYGIAGSILRVERTADTIRFTINGISLGNVVDTVDARKAWKIKGMVHGWANTKLVNVGCSFGYNSDMSVSPSVTNYQNDTLRGSVDLNISGGHPPYNVAWNNIKLPPSTVAYHTLLSMGYPVGADSTVLKQQFDSIRQNTVFAGLMPGQYPVTVYDANNDSLKAVVVIGVDADTVLSKGLTVEHPSSYKDTRNGLLYLYGKGIDLKVSGGIVPGENLAVLSSVVSPLKASLFEFSIPDTSSLTVGLTRIQEVIPYGTDDMKSKAAFVFEGNSYSVYVGNLLRYTGTYYAGDLFSISGSETGTLRFYKNDTEVFATEFASIAAPGDEFLYKTVLNRANAKLIKIKVGTPISLAFGVTGTVKDVSCSSPCSGSIDVVGRGKLISSPDRYELYAVTNPGTPVATVNTFPSGNHALFTGLCPGKYTVKFYYTYQELVLWGGTPVTSTGLLVGNFEVAYVPEWTNAVNVTISPDRSLTKTAGITDWDAGASTENFLKSTDNGWIEWTSPSVESINAIGFNDVDQSLDITDIDYANGYFKFNTGFLGVWKYFIKTHNSLMINSLFVNGYTMHPFVENQKFRLEKEVVGGVTTIKLFCNNSLTDQFTGITATGYVVDASLKQLLGTVNNPRVSFGCGTSNTQYAVPKREADGGYYTLDGVNLKFTLDGEYTLSTMKFKVLDHARTVAISGATSAGLLSVITTKPGDNRYTLDCSGLSAGYYTLEVSNEKNEKLYLRFKR